MKFYYFLVTYWNFYNWSSIVCCRRWGGCSWIRLNSASILLSHHLWIHHWLLHHVRITHWWWSHHHWLLLHHWSLHHWLLHHWLLHAIWLLHHWLLHAIWLLHHWLLHSHHRLLHSHHWLLLHHWLHDHWRWLNRWRLYNWCWCLNDHLNDLWLFFLFFWWLILNGFDIVWLDDEFTNDFGFVQQWDFLMIGRLRFHLINHYCALSKKIVGEGSFSVKKDFEKACWLCNIKLYRFFKLWIFTLIINSFRFKFLFPKFHCDIICGIRKNSTSTFLQLSCNKCDFKFFNRHFYFLLIENLNLYLSIKNI